MRLPFALQHQSASVIYFKKEIKKAKEAFLVICFAVLKNSVKISSTLCWRCQQKLVVEVGLFHTGGKVHAFEAG